MRTRTARCFPGVMIARWSGFVLLLGAAVLPAASHAASAAFGEAGAIAFTDRHCSTCHNDVDREGGLDLATLGFNPQDPANYLIWVKVHDRVSAGEMPPKEKRAPQARRNLRSSADWDNRSLPWGRKRTGARVGRRAGG